MMPHHTKRVHQMMFVITNPIDARSFFEIIQINVLYYNLIVLYCISYIATQNGMNTALTHDAFMYLKSLFPWEKFERRLPPIVLHQQLYSLVSDRSIVDEQLVSANRRVVSGDFLQ